MGNKLIDIEVFRITTSNPPLMEHKLCLPLEFDPKLEKPSPWELGSDIIGKYASGQNNLSQDRKTLLKEKIRARILIDSGPLIALFDRNDKHHQASVEFIKTNRNELITTHASITEVYTYSI